MMLAIGFLLLGGAFALPSSPTPTPTVPHLLDDLQVLASQLPFSSAVPAGENSDEDPERCAINDPEIWTSENWESKEEDSWIFNYSPIFFEFSNLDRVVAQDWGLGPSFSCDVDNECHAPKCSDLKKPSDTSHYEHAAMLLASMANFNNQYARIWQALDGAKIDFASISARLQQEFYPGITPADMAKIQGLSAGGVVVGIISALAGPFKDAFNVGKELYNGMSRGISAILGAVDASMGNLAELESVFSDRLDKVRGEFVTLHDSIIKEDGMTMWRIFKDGAYVNRGEITILNDLSVEDVRGYLREVFFSMTINNIWVKQGAYIFSREMDEQTCNEKKPLADTSPHLCYEGRIYWLNKHIDADFLNPSSIDPLPGAEKLEEVIGLHFHDAMRSSIDAFNAGGYKYDPDNIDDLFDGDIREKFAAGGRYRGIWNIPVCEVESSEQIGDTKLKDPADYYWGVIDTNDADATFSHAQGLQACLCSTAKDRNGVSIMELEGGDGTWRDVLNDQVKCDFGDIFFYVKP